MKSRNILTRFTLLEFFFYTYMGAFTPYMISLGLDRGYSQTSVSLAVSFQMVCVLLGNTLWGRISDRFRTNKKTFIAAMACCIAFQSCFYFSPNFPLFFLMYGIFGTCSGAMGVLLDTWFLKCIHYDISTFRKVRSAGSLGYGVAILASGLLVERAGYGCVFYVSIVLLMLTIVLCRGVDEVRPERRNAQDLARGGRGMAFLGNHMYLIWVLLLLILGLATAPVGNLKIVILERLGSGADALGMDGFLGCLVQFIMFFAVSRLERFSPVGRMTIASLWALIGIVLYITASGPVMVYMGSMLLYGIFSIVNPCTREIVRDHVDVQDQTTAIGIADACSNNVSTMISMLYSGMISERFGMQTLLVVCFGMAVFTMGLCLMMVSARRRPLHPRKHFA